MDALYAVARFSDVAARGWAMWPKSPRRDVPTCSVTPLPLDRPGQRNLLLFASWQLRAHRAFARAARPEGDAEDLERRHRRRRLHEPAVRFAGHAELRP